MGYERTFSKSLNLATFLIFLSLLLLFLDQKQALNPLKKLVQTISVPVQFSVYGVAQSVQGQVQNVLDARLAVQKNKALSGQYAQVLSELSRLHTVEEENKILRSQMETLSQEKYQLAPVGVLGFGRNLLIDRGLDAGLGVGQVVVYQNNLVGKIISLTPRMAQVALPTSADVKIPVFVQASGSQGGRAVGITVGQFGSGILLDRVLQEEKISEGDLVLTSGDGDYPRGLIVGKIKKVEKKETDIFQKAQVEPLFEYENLQTVFVSL